MPDHIARKRLKKKMLDRWENEGGMISADLTSAHESSPTSEQESEGNQPSASPDNSKVGTRTVPQKKAQGGQK